MDWEPRVGMRVACINSDPVDVGPIDAALDPKGLIKGNVYTIRWAGGFSFYEGVIPAVRLVEYIRDEDDYPVGAWRFRPLDERRLDIFREALTKAPTPEKEPV